MVIMVWGGPACELSAGGSRAVLRESDTGIVVENLPREPRSIARGE
jgi:hypothetical protein